MNDVRVRYSYNIGSDDYDLFVVRRAGVVRPAYLKAEWVEFEQGAIGIVQPTLNSWDSSTPSPRQIVQQIMDAAWNEGLRPTGFAEIKNQTQAMQNHIDDLRVVSTKLLSKMCGP